MTTRTLSERVAALAATSPFSEAFLWTGGTYAKEVHGVFDDPTLENPGVEMLIEGPTVDFAVGDVDGIAVNHQLVRVATGVRYNVGEVTFDGAGGVLVKLTQA